MHDWDSLMFVPAFKIEINCVCNNFECENAHNITTHLLVHLLLRIPLRRRHHSKQMKTKGHQEGGEVEREDPLVELGAPGQWGGEKKRRSPGRGAQEEGIRV